MSVRLFILDDHAVVRDGIRLISEQASDIEVVGEASGVEEALEAIEAARPDVILVDLNMPGGSGIELIKEVHTRWPEVRTIVLTVERDEDVVIEAMNSGAAGFVTKDSTLPAILDAVRRAYEGETVVQGMSTGRLIQRVVSFAKEAERSIQLISELSPRERQVLALLADGRSNQQIGSALGISSRTAATHVASIYRKLGVTNRVDAAREAIRLGISPSGR